MDNQKGEHNSSPQRQQPNHQPDYSQGHPDPSYQQYGQVQGYPQGYPHHHPQGYPLFGNNPIGAPYPNGNQNEQGIPPEQNVVYPQAQPFGPSQNQLFVNPYFDENQNQWIWFNTHARRWEPGPLPNYPGYPHAAPGSQEQFGGDLPSQNLSTGPLHRGEPKTHRQTVPNIYAGESATDPQTGESATDPQTGESKTHPQLGEGDQSQTARASRKKETIQQGNESTSPPEISQDTSPGDLPGNTQVKHIYTKDSGDVETIYSRDGQVDVDMQEVEQLQQEAKVLQQRGQKLKSLVPQNPDEPPPPYDEVCQQPNEGREEGGDMVIEVRGLPPDVSDDTLTFYFENKRKSAGGPVRGITTLLEGRALVYFEDTEVVRRVLSKEDHKIKGKIVEVVQYNPSPVRPSQSFEPMETETSANVESHPPPDTDKIQVTGFGDIDIDVLEMYFENPKRGGGSDVKDIVRTNENQVVVTFRDASAVQSVLDKGLHTVSQRKLHVTRYSPSQPSTSQPDLSTEPLDSAPPRTIIVNGCSELSDDVLGLYFENTKKSGGGNMEDFTRQQDNNLVKITFENQTVVETILSRSHKLQGKELKVTLYVPKPATQVPQETEEETKPPDTILVRGCDGMSDDTIIMYFENTRRSGGGEVKELKRIENTEDTLITFENPMVVDEVVSRKHKLSGRELEVSVFVPPKKSPKLSWDLYVEQGEDGPDEEDENDDEDDNSMFVLEVKCLPDNVSEETIGLYFENRRRSAGGNVEKVEMYPDIGSALVYFEEGDVVARVIQKIQALEGKNLQVSPYLPPKTSSKGEDSLAWLKRYPEGSVLAVSDCSHINYDTVELYFENKKRSGAVVNEIIHEEEDVLYLIYETSQEASVVADKSHRIDGNDIQVSVCVAPPPPPPRPKYPDRFLIQGLSESTEKKSLIDFLKVKCQLKVTADDLIYGEVPGSVLVSTGRIPPGVKRLRKICKKHPLEGAFLHISAVPVSNCILVQGIVPTSSMSALELYFESKRSGNTLDVEVERLEHTTGEDHALVYFKDHRVIPKILAKAHKLDGTPLEVSLYCDCLGITGGDSEPNWFRIPDPLKLEKLNKYKLRFIKSSKLNKKTFEEQLAGDFADVEWQDESSVVLTCTLQKETKNSRELIKTWKKNSTESVEHYFSLLMCEEIKVLNSIWQAVIDKLPSLTVSKQDAATFYVIDDDKLLVVVGHTSVFGKLFEKVKNIVTSIEEEQERKKLEITETITSLKPLVLLYLNAVGFPNDMMSKFNGLRVDIDVANTAINFTGLLQDVKSAQLKMYEETNVVSMQPVTTISEVLMEFSLVEDVRQYITQKLVARQTIGVWLKVKKTLHFMAKTDQDVKKVVDVFQESVKQQTIALDPESEALLRSSEWHDLVSSFQTNRLKIIQAANNQQVIIVGTDDEIAQAVEDINNYIQEKTIYSESVQYPRGIQRFLTNHFGEDLRALSTKFTSYSLEVIFERTSSDFTLKGTKEGLKIALIELDKLADSVHNKAHSFSKPGMAKLILSEKGQHYVDSVEISERCIVEREFDKSERKVIGQKKGRPMIASGGPQVYGTCDLDGGRSLHVAQGDITQMNVDAIVNAANSRLDHIGGLARAIVDKGGRSIQDESRAIIHRRGEIKTGNVAVTGCGSLPCKVVIHAVGPIWSGGHQGEEEQLREAIFNTLQEANNRRLTSVAIPALSTGIYHYPVARATKTIIDAIMTHFQDYPGSSVQDVFLCDNNMKTISEFMKAGDIKVKGSTVRGHTQRSPTSGRFDDDHHQHASEQPRPRPRQRKAYPPREQFSHSSIQIHIVQGEIAKQTVDVIVNTTSGNLELRNGAVSKSILARAGVGIQQECSTNYPQGISLGEVAVTSGGNMKCNFVFHTCLPSWSKNMGQQILKTLILECLSQASQRGVASISFPALGTGNLGYPKSLVSRVMFEAINEFGQQKTSIKEARIVVYPADKETIKAFDSAGYRSNSTRCDRKFADPSDTSSLDEATGGSDMAQDWHTVSSSDFENVFPIGKVQMTIKQGDITREQASCIVNSTNSSLNLNQGAVSLSILNAGGQRLIDDCNSKKKEMKKQGVVVTGAYGLPAEFIAHIDLHHFQGDIKKGVQKCLKAASSFRDIRSIAFPALGTGNLETNVADVSDAFIAAVKEYQGSESERGVIKDIRMVIFQSGMIEQFTESLSNSLKAKKGWGRKFFDLVTGSGGDEDQTPGPLRIPVERDLTLYFFSDRDRSILSAIDSMENKCNQDIYSKTVQEDDLKNLTAKQRTRIEKLAEKYSVKVDYNPRMGRVHLSGLTVDVSNASDEIQKILREQHRAEVEQEKAEMLSNMVQWHFVEIDRSGASVNTKYDQMSNQKIESAYKKNDPVAKLVDSNGDTYIVDFKQMIEYPENDHTDDVPVIRKDLIKGITGMIDNPPTWTPMTKESEIIQLTAGTPEYTTVEQKFIQGTGGVHPILKIERVQTKFLWQQYIAKKQQIDSQNAQGKQNERELWHGTAANAIPSICNGGFNRSYCGKNATVYGEGVYFAVNANYSAQRQYSPSDGNGHRHMFLARVLTGDYTQGKRGTRVPPLKQGHILFDSCVENVGAPTIFIIYNDTQAYPEYLITFQ